jgi:hypothetical protein
MTSKGNGQPTSYRVIMAEQIRTRLRQLHQQAFQRGTGHEFLDALRQILRQLRDTPLTFGEPLYRLPTLQLAVRQGMIGPLVVDYGVHEIQPLVFVSGFKVLT